ncbi:small integral membrane protein 32 [Carassius auratus]|uniref:Small integral membrane protein 32 n=1 Tax=Carassius auratus TaxID=7957 RepID=A0A6P6MUI4_CARAU|nr:small integral membrane protein 32 [Carassius auratus]XP_052470803.1 small integral membrane protein 32-like [Carassius gibelio]XP_059378405.1 small integral membrane protein 32-like [Carassius carassius]
MLRQMLLNSTAAARDFDLMSNTHTQAPLSHGPVSVLALLKPTGRGSALREGEPDKPDLATYVVMCLVLFLLVLLIVFFINCQLRNSFFASMPYDRSLREARSSYK